MSEKTSNATLVKRLRAAAIMTASARDRNIMTDAADRIEYLAQFTDWQPIEIAPNNGTRVLAGKKTDSGFLVLDYYFNLSFAIMCGATHWLTLPPMQEVK